MLFKSFPLHICTALLIFMGIIPNLAHTRPQIVLYADEYSVQNELSIHGENEYFKISSRQYTDQSWNHEFLSDTKRMFFENVTFAEKTLLAKNAGYNLSGHIYAFSALRHAEDRLSQDERRSSVAGLGWHVLNDGINRLDLDIGAGNRVIKWHESNDTERDTIGRLGAQFTSQLTPSSQFRQGLVIEATRSSTSTESMTTWSFAMNPQLALEVLFSVRKNSNPSPDPLAADRHTAASLTYVF